MLVLGTMDFQTAMGLARGSDSCPREAFDSYTVQPTPLHREAKDLDFEDRIFYPDIRDLSPACGQSVAINKQDDAGLDDDSDHGHFHQRPRTNTTSSGVSDLLSGFSFQLLDDWPSKSTSMKATSSSAPTAIDSGWGLGPIASHKESRNDFASLTNWWGQNTHKAVHSPIHMTSEVAVVPIPSTWPASAPTNLSEETIRITQRIHAERARLAARNGRARFQRFIPSRAILERTNHPSQYSAQPTGAAAAQITPYYASAAIHPAQNCALWLTGIPSSASYADLLSGVRGGKIFACLMNPPTADHATSAAKLVFFTRAAAAAFLARTLHPTGIVVRGVRLRASWNRILYAEYHDRGESRTVVISGPRELMSFAFFDAFFAERFIFDLEARFELPHSRAANGVRPGWVSHVWIFASLRAQAESARISVERELGGIFEVRYGNDPCNVPLGEDL